MTRDRCPWAPRVGELLLVNLGALRDLDGRYLPMPDVRTDFCSRPDVVAVVLARRDGSADWTVVTLLSELGTATVQATSKFPEQSFKRLEKASG